MSSTVPTPDDFADERFTAFNRHLIDDFIALHLQGWSLMHCMRVVFGEECVMDGQGFARLYGLQRNTYYRSTMEARIETIDPKLLWTPKRAAHALLCLVRDVNEKGSVKLAAAKELNVMFDITVVDENGKTKASRGLRDFYEDAAGESAAPGADSTDSAVTGLEPSPTTH